MEFEETLAHSCGLSTNEAKTYLALIKVGSSKAGKISKEASIDRTSTYNSLKGLMEKGLAAYVTIGKTKWFQASDPKNLKLHLDNKLEDLLQLMPQLEKHYATTKLPSNVRLFKGTKGIKTILNMILTEKENRVFGSESQIEKVMPFFSAKFKSQLNARGVKTKNLVRRGRSVLESKHSKFRFLPQKVESPVVTNIFGDKIAVIIWSDVPEAILIDNKEASKAYGEYFDFMWKNAAKK